MTRKRIIYNKAIQLAVLILFFSLLISDFAYAANSKPLVGTITPASGSSGAGSEVALTTTYSDANGWQNIQYVYLLINTSTSGTKCFYGYYNQNANKLYIRNDANSAWLGGYTPGAGGIIENSYIKLDCSKTTISGSGNVLTVKWYITFKPQFRGSKYSYLYVKDDANAYNGWTRKGSWTITNQAPTVGTITPASGSGQPNTETFFTTTFADPNGWEDIQYAYFLINTAVNLKNCFYGYYNQNTNKLYIRNNANTGWLGGRAPGSSYTIENSYAKLNCASTTVSGSGNIMTVKWAVTFKSTFTGAKNMYLYVKDDANAYQNWTQKGAWTISADSTPPTGTIKINNDAQYTTSTSAALTLSAQDNTGGSGVSQMQFSNDGATYSTPEAYATARTWTLTTGDGSKTVYVKFKDNAGNWSVAYSDTIILDITPPPAPVIDPVTSPTNTNRQTITGTKSQDTAAIIITCPTATVGTLAYPSATTWSCELTNLSPGTNNISAVAADAAGNKSSSVAATIRYNQKPSVGTIIPSSGSSNSGEAVGFSTTFTDPDGWEDIKYVLFLINTSTDPKNCFYGTYDKDKNKLYLRNNDGSTPMGGYIPGSANKIENSYCALDCSKTTVSGSGNTLTVSWNITFKTSFAGSKNMYIYAVDYANAGTGWVNKGTWTITQQDTTPPTGTIKINNDAQYANSTSVTLTLSAQDNTGGSGLYQMKFSNDNTNWSTAEAYSTTKTWTLTSGDGVKTVYVKFSDNAGNWSLAYSDTITLDVTVPSTTSSGIDNAWHNSPVTVTLTATDTTSGINKTYYSIDGSNPAVVYASPFTISNEGVYTVKYYSTDKAGNSEAVKTAPYQVKIDKTSPQGTISINNGAESTNQTQVTLNLSATDALSGVYQMRFSNDNTNWSTPEAYASTKSWTLTDGNGTKTVYAQFKDNAGNWSGSVTDTIILQISSTPAANGYRHIYESMDRYRTGSTLRLIESYYTPYPPAQEKAAWVYDNALAIIALLARHNPEDITRARILCDALIYCQDNDPSRDGRLRNSYYADAIPSAKNSYSYCGNMAWAIIGLMQYYRFSEDTDTAFLNRVLSASDKLGRFIVTAYSDPNNPGYCLKEGVTYKSTENNISAYVAFKHLYDVTNDTYWKEKANSARVFVTTYMDDSTKFCVGSTDNGISVNDYYLEQTEDVNAWGVLAFGYKYKYALTFVENNCWTQKSSFTGFDFNTDKDGVWFEGVAHMACAYEYIGDADKTALFLTNLERAQTDAQNNNDKGITATPDNQVSTGFGEYYYPSLHLGATSWFLLAETNYNAFWGTKLEKPKLIANIGRDMTINVGSSVRFDATASTGDNPITLYEWDFGDGFIGGNEAMYKTYDTAGTYEVKLRIRDAAGNIAEDNCFVTVKVIGAYDVKARVGHGTFGLVNNGWATAGTAWQNKLKVKDIDADGTEEIVLGNNQGYLHSIKYQNGSYIDDWTSRNLAEWLISSVACDDVDKDGEVEIVMSEWRVDQCEIYLFGGKTKTQKGAIPLTNIFTVYTGDIDNDAIPEIIAGTTNGEIYIYDGKTKAQKGRITKTGTVRAINAIDLNADNKKEIIAVIEADLFVFNGATLQEMNKLTNTSNMCSVEIVDIDKDGYKEIVTSDTAGYIHVFDQRNLTKEWDSQQLSGPIYTLKLYDVDSDGTVEIIAGAGKKIYVFDGVTKTKEYESADFVSNIFDLDIGDPDKDNTKEIVVGLDVGSLYVLDGKTKAIEWQSVGGQFYTLEVSDIDGDNKLEYIAADELGFVYIFDGTTNALKWKSDKFDEKIINICTQDVDENGSMDLVFNTTKKIYIYDGSTKQKKLEIAVNNPQGLAVDDFDKDGHVEIVTYSSTDGYWYGFNGKTGQIKWKSRYTPGYSGSYIKVGDVDNDGQLECILTAYDYFYVFNPVTGDCEWKSPLMQASGIRGVGVNDVDNDNTIEILAQTHTGGPLIYDGKTKELENSYGYRWNYGLGIGDVDSDPNLEIILACGAADWVSLYFIDGKTRQTEYYSSYLGEFVGNKDSIRVIDIDGDGKNEVLAGSDGYIIIFATPGTGKGGSDTSSPIITCDLSNDAIIYGAVNINIKATDNVAVSKIGCFVDDVLVDAVNNRSNFQWILETTAYSEGQHILKIVAYDSSGNKGVKEIRVGIANSKPNSPTTPNVVTPTYVTPLSIDGTKPAYTSLWINGTKIVSYNTSAAWSTIVTLNEGENIFTITTKDFFERESFPLFLRVFLDTTAPTTPVVTDDGDTTGYMDRLHARWTSSDPQTGIAEYKISIGSQPNVRDVVDWTSVGTATEYTASNLTLVNTKTYYFMVQAKNAAGKWSSTGISNGITVQYNPPVITAYAPAKFKRFIAGDIVSISITATNPEGGQLVYRISIDGQIKSDWSTTSNYAWTTNNSNFGRHVITLEARNTKGAIAKENIPVFVVHKPIDLPTHK